MKVKVKVSYVRLFVTPWAIQSMEYSRPEYWSGWLFPSPADLPDPGMELGSPTLQANSLPSEPLGQHDLVDNLFNFQLVKNPPAMWETWV